MGKFLLKQETITKYWKYEYKDFSLSRISSSSGWIGTSSGSINEWNFFRGSLYAPGSATKPLPIFTLKSPIEKLILPSVKILISGYGNGVGTYDLYKNDELVQRVKVSGVPTRYTGVDETITLQEPLVLTNNDTLKVVCISYTSAPSGYYTSFSFTMNLKEEVKVSSTEDDYDFITEESKYTSFNKGTTKKYWKNWVQPTNPEGITATSGWENPKNAFDNSDSTYARCNSLTEYIEYDLGEDVILTGLNTKGNQINSQAVATNMKCYSVDRYGNQTLLCSTQGAANTAPYYTSATIPNVKVNKVRFYITATYSNAPSRTIQITLSGYKEGTKEDYDFVSGSSRYLIFKK